MPSRTDPWAYAGEYDPIPHEQAIERLQKYFRERIQKYDQGVLDPLVMAIPEADRKVILDMAESVEGQIEQRVFIARAALKILMKNQTSTT
jgi:hypothetical protein